MKINDLNVTYDVWQIEIDANNKKGDKWTLLNSFEDITNAILFHSACMTNNDMQYTSFEIVVDYDDAD